METPTATPKQKQKPAEKFVTLPGDAEESAKRWRQEEIPRAQFQPGPPAPPTPSSRRHIDARSWSTITASEASGSERGVDDGRGLQRKRDRIWDSRAKTSHTAKEKEFLGQVPW